MDALPFIPTRDPQGHKGTFGVVAVVGGCARRAGDQAPGSLMLGAPALCAAAALRAGCGRARLAMPEPLLPWALSIAPCATGVAFAVDHAGEIIAHLAAPVIDDLVSDAGCVVIGPGLGTGAAQQAMALRALNQDTCPVLVDADALNTIAEVMDFHRELRAAAVFTPHVGEFARLAAPLGITDDPSDPRTREAAAIAMAQKLGCVVVLKSAATVVTDGVRTWTMDQPNAALATGGSGDVLSGIIAGLVASHARLEGVAGRAGGLALYDCARLGVAAHARAGRRWTERRGVSAGLLASDLLDEIPESIQTLRAPSSA